MKKITFLSLVAATVLFTACGEETKKAASEATAATTEAIKKDTSDVVEAAKAKAAEVAETVKTKAAAAQVEAEKMAAAAKTEAVELKTAAEAKTTEVVEAVKEKTAEVAATASTAVAAATSSAPAAYAKCKGCHGEDGKTQALGKSAVIAGQDKAALVASINEYKAGTRNVAGMGMLMKGQVAAMSDADIEAVAEYLSTVK